MILRCSVCPEEILGRAYYLPDGKPVHRGCKPRQDAVDPATARADAERFEAGTKVVWIRYRKGGAMYGEEVPVTVVSQVGARVVVQCEDGTTFPTKTHCLRRPSSTSARPMRTASPAIPFRKKR